MAHGVLEMLEREGEVQRTNEFVTTPDGVTLSRYKLFLDGEESEKPIVAIGSSPSPRSEPTPRFSLMTLPKHLEIGWAYLDFTNLFRQP